MLSNDRSSAAILRVITSDTNILNIQVAEGAGERFLSVTTLVFVLTYCLLNAQTYAQCLTTSV